MRSPSVLPSQVKSVVVVRALAGMGDILCVIPALRALRAGLPDSHVALVTMPEVGSLVARFPRYVDEVIPFAGFPGIPEKEFEAVDLPRFYGSMVARRFDLALQMQGSGVISNSLTVMLGARLNAGFYLPGQYCPDPGFFLPYPDHLHEVRRHLALMDFLGMPKRGEWLEFPVTAGDRSELHRLLNTLDVANSGHLRADLRAGEYVCVHPGAMARPRCWSPVGFAKVADELAAEGLTVVFTGQAFESGRVAMIRGLMKAPSIDLTGKTSLGALAALLEGARLLICNDTGVSHLAAALAVPSVVIFAGKTSDGSEPHRWAPLDSHLHWAVTRGGGVRAVPVAVDNVLAAVRAQLQREIRPPTLLGQVARVTSLGSTSTFRRERVGDDERWDPLSRAAPRRARSLPQSGSGGLSPVGSSRPVGPARQTGR